MKGTWLALVSLVLMFAGTSSEAYAETTCMTNDLLMVPESDVPHRSVRRTVKNTSSRKTSVNHIANSKKIVATANPNSESTPVVKSN